VAANIISIMKYKHLKILLWTGFALLLVVFITAAVIKHSVRKRIEAILNEENSAYNLAINNIDISILSRGISLERIKIVSNTASGGLPDLNGEIASIKIRGVKLVKAVFRKEIIIRKITVTDSYFKGKITSSGKAGKPIVLPLNIKIDNIVFDKINLSFDTDSSAASYSVKDGNLIFHSLQAQKHDTLSTGILNSFDFSAKELVLVSADSMYSYLFRDNKYSANSKMLDIDSFSIQPNYDDYNFTARYKFQKSRIEAGFSNISVHGFNPSDYIRSGTIASSGVEIGKMDMKVFKDKRKEFHHQKKAAFQDLIYSYPDTIRIDSIDLSEGSITYTEHAEGANEHGSLSFKETSARIYNITNDTIYKTETEYLKLEAESMLMGKGKVIIQLKAKLFDNDNSFSVNGNLSDMEAQELNPFLEKTAFIYATSGNIKEMDFSFSADNTNASGEMTFLYNGLDLTLKNKKTDEITAIRERIISILVNRKVLDSNPLPDKEVRVGIIEYSRDPEKFLFSYCAKCIMSGIRSSILK
jgi:hypothetical protein